MTRYDHVLQAARRLEQELELALSAHGADETAEELCAAAEEAVRTGRPQDAAELLDRAEAERPERSILARIRYARSIVGPPYAPPVPPADLVAEAEAVEQSDLALATRLLVAAALDLRGERALAEEAARRAAQIAGRSRPEQAALAGLALEASRILAGTRPATTVLESALAALDLSAFDAPIQLHRVAALAFWGEDYETARRTSTRLLELVQAEHALTALALDTLAAVDLRTGGWSSAERRSRKALALATAGGDAWQAASCSTTLAALAALTGREDECRVRLVEAAQLAPASVLIGAWRAAIAGLLELGLQRAEAAIAELERVEAHALGPTVVLWLPNLIQAYAEAQRRDAARARLEQLERQLVDSQGHLGRATLARSRGILARRGFEAHFAEALDLHARAGMPFETARTHLCFGERLRRARRRDEAHLQLHAALTTFTFLGARPWADRARAELGIAASRPEDPASLLTAHELQVASLVVRGATNREAAAALFVSPKTVDYHLGNIYRKLEVRSRTELTRLLSRSL